MDRRFLGQFIDSQRELDMNGMIAALYPSDLSGNMAVPRQLIIGHAAFWLIQIERHLRLYGDSELYSSWKPAISNLSGWFEQFRRKDNLFQGVAPAWKIV
jgi:hypothetical protein